jgi:hypothetical protein
MVAEAWVSRAGSYPALRFAEVLLKWIVFYLKRKRWRSLDEINRGDGGPG